ncbi:MAG: hypothetical protein ABSF90_19855 [Syntrophobacteraceae bacterium]
MNRAKVGIQDEKLQAVDIADQVQRTNNKAREALKKSAQIRATIAIVPE